MSLGSPGSATTPVKAQDWGLTPFQIAILTLALIGGTAIVSLPSILSEYTGQTAWLAALVPLPVGLVPLWLLYDLDRRLPGMTLVEQARAAGGPVWGSVLGLLPVVFLATSTPVILREFGDLILGAALPRTPAVVVLSLLALPAVYAGRRGPEVIARLGELLVPLAVALLLAAALASLRQLRLVNLMPWTGPGWGPLLRAAAPTAAFYAETMILGFILPLRGHSRRACWAGAAGGLVAVAMLVALAAAWSVMSFGPNAGQMADAMFQVARLAHVAEFLTHIESIVLVVWMAGGFVKMAVWFYAFCFSTAQWLGLRDYRPLTLPAASYVVIGALTWFESSASLSGWIARIWPFWGFGFGFGVPLLIWLTAVWQGRRERGAREGRASP